MFWLLKVTCGICRLSSNICLWNDESTLVCPNAGILLVILNRTEYERRSLIWTLESISSTLWFEFLRAYATLRRCRRNQVSGLWKRHQGVLVSVAEWHFTCLTISNLVLRHPTILKAVNDQREAIPRTTQPLVLQSTSSPHPYPFPKFLPKSRTSTKWFCSDFFILRIWK